jgi:hypothetical protein
MAREPSKVNLRVTGDFAGALDKIVIDAAFREKLDRNPIEAFAEIGVEINPDAKAILAGKRLSEMLPTHGGHPGDTQACVACLVVVGVAIGTNLSVRDLGNRASYRKAIRAHTSKAIAGSKPAPSTGTTAKPSRKK